MHKKELETILEKIVKENKADGLDIYYEFKRDHTVEIGLATHQTESNYHKLEDVLINANLFCAPVKRIIGAYGGNIKTEIMFEFYPKEIIY